MSNTGFGVGQHGLNAAVKAPRTRLLHPRPQPRACTPGPGGIGQGNRGLETDSPGAKVRTGKF